MLNIERIVEPTEEPITIDEAKANSRVDGPDEDALIMGLIVAARQQAEEVTHRALVTQTWRMRLGCWPSEPLFIPRAPLQSITSITYTDELGAAGTVPATDYVVTSGGNQKGYVSLARGANWPSVALQSGGSIVVEFVAGYGDPGDVPQVLKQAMLLMISHWFENREEAVITPGATVVAAPMAAKSILTLQRAW